MRVAEITYHLAPESLAGVDEGAFSEAFENEIYAIPLFQNASVRILPGGVTGAVDIAGEVPAAVVPKLREQVRVAAALAFRHCRTADE